MLEFAIFCLVLFFYFVCFTTYTDFFFLNVCTRTSIGIEKSFLVMIPSIFCVHGKMYVCQCCTYAWML